MGPTDKLVNLAASQNHYSETPTNRTKYGQEFGLNGVYWCSIFVWWVVKHALGMDLKKILTGGYASCASAMDAFRAHGALRSHPKVGYVVFYHFPGEHAGANHTGIVSKVYPDGSINAWEGNTNEAGSRSGGQVLQKHRASNIIGYGDLSALPGYPRPTAPAAPAPTHQAAPSRSGGGSGRIPSWYHRVLRDHPGGAIEVGHDVQVVQHKVGAHVDGRYGHETAHAVSVWQAKHGLEHDGIVGSQTATKMGE